MAREKLVEHERVVWEEVPVETIPARERYVLCLVLYYGLTPPGGT